MLSFLLDKKCFWSIHNTSNSINIAGNILEDDINTLSHINIDNLNTLITMDEEETIIYEGVVIEVLPVWKWLLMEK
jgi:predicted AAA+ superfamily ATPase